MPLAARSASTTSCSYQTSHDGGAPWPPSNSTDYCGNTSDGGVVALTLCIIGPFVLIIIIFLGFLLLQWIRPRLPGNGPSRSRNHDEPKPNPDPDVATLEKIDFDGKGGGGDDGSATCVSVNNPAEVDISSLSYHDQSQSNHSVMPFLRKGLFRAMSSSSCPAESQGAPPVYNFQATQPAPQSTAQLADNNGVGDAEPGMDVYAGAGAGNIGGPTDSFSSPTPTFQSTPALATTTSRLRSFSESTITLSSSSQFHSAHQSGPGSRAPSSTSLPSSPSIPPPPTGTRSGTGASNSGTPSMFSLSLSEKLERLNKQMMQKKTSNSSLRGSELDSPICGSTGKGSGYGQTDDGDTSMDFKCRGLPESGTFSALTDLEAAMRVEDELATIERLASRM